MTNVIIQGTGLWDGALLGQLRGQVWRRVCGEVLKRTEPGPLLGVGGTSEETGHQLHSGVCGHGKGGGVEQVGEGVLGIWCGGGER